jgi:predicted nucleic acid-binding protein
LVVTLVDTSIWIDHFNGRETDEVFWLRNTLSDESETLVIGDLILLEVLQGFRLQRHFDLAYRALSALRCFALANRPRCVAAALNDRKLRSRGVTVRSSIDVLIATFCIEADIGLLHNDRDFDAFAHHLGLRVIEL